MKPPQPTACTLCGRDKPLTFHHLIPRKVHGKRHWRANHSREELARNGIWVCRLCHRQIHRFFSEADLAESLNTAAALRKEPQMARFIGWARKQK